MPLIALFAVILAAVAHSFWNFLAKRHADCKNLIFFSSIGEVVLLSPVVALAGLPARPLVLILVCLLATGVLHLLYSEALLRGYRSADLSVVYPLARGTGPLLTFVGAAIFLRERPTMLSAVGTLLIAGGIVVVCGGVRALLRHDARAGLRWGLATGLTIAAYTLVDGYTVKAVAISPFVVDYAGNLFRVVAWSAALGRNFQHKRSAFLLEYRRCWKAALCISILMPGAYILVLYAMRIAPVSRVAPAREMSMMIASWMGAKLLNEGNMGSRIAGSCLIALGVIALATQ